MYDIRQIQKFIFSSDKNVDILGSNGIIGDVLDRALAYALEHNATPLQKDEYSLVPPCKQEKVPYFHDEKIQVQVISIGGGNAFLLYRKGFLAQNVNHIFSRYLIDNTYSLEVAIACVERTNCYCKDFNRLYLELDRVKASAPSSQTLGTLPIVECELSTGYPIIGIDKDSGEKISMETLLKRERVRRETKLTTRYYNINKIAKNNQTLAYIHMDGNSMGITIGKIVNEIEDYEEGIKARSQIDANINENYMGALDETESWMKGVMLKDGICEDEILEHMQRIHVGGDDINMVFDAKYVFGFVEHFLKNAAGRYLWNDERIGKIPFSACAGIAFVSAKIPAKVGLGLAEECCEQAKVEAKKPENLIDGRVGNWIDFHVLRGFHMQSLEPLREQAYVVDGNRSLLMRPYVLDEELKDLPCYFDHFKENYKTLFDGGLSQTECKNLEDAYSLGFKSISNALRALSTKNKKIPQFMKTPFVKVPTRDEECAVGFDILEVRDFYRDLGE